jgi:CubicO group peptidase (beta-lactamase class C family)
MNIPSNFQRSGFSQERLSRLSHALEGYVERGEIAGVVTLLYRHGVLAHLETHGWQDREAQIPMQRDSIFRIASMTKPLATVAALTLVEEGHIRLFDPVDSFLPELANSMVMRDPNGSLDDVYPSPRAITLHDLLTYRLGIGWEQSPLFPWLRTLAVPPFADGTQIPQVERLAPDAWLARVSELPLLYEPGAHWLYHVASDVLGILLTRLTGQPLETVLRERVFEPLGMEDTSFVVPAEKRGRLAVLDHPATSGWANPPRFASAAAGLVSTAGDYLRFARMLLGKGELEGVSILSRKTVEAMTTDYLTPEQHTHAFFGRDVWANLGFGYGVAMRIRQSGLGPGVGSFFWPGAFGTAWYVDPQEDLVASIFLQLNGAVMADLWLNPVGDDFLTLTYQAITD